MKAEAQGARKFRDNLDTTGTRPKILGLSRPFRDGWQLCIGEEAETVLDSTGLTEEERKQYATVLWKLDEHFKVRQNTIFERARFNRRYQQERESAEAYITELYRLSENCKYGDLRDEMIRDRLVVGIRNQALSQQLQMDPELTLERAKKRIRQ